MYKVDLEKKDLISKPKEVDFGDYLNEYSSFICLLEDTQEVESGYTEQEFGEFCKKHYNLRGGKLFRDLDSYIKQHEPGVDYTKMDPELKKTIGEIHGIAEEINELFKKDIDSDTIFQHLKLTDLQKKLSEIQKLIQDKKNVPFQLKN